MPDGLPPPPPMPTLRLRSISPSLLSSALLVSSGCFSDPLVQTTEVVQPEPEPEPEPEPSAGDSAIPVETDGGSEPGSATDSDGAPQTGSGSDDSTTGDDSDDSDEPPDSDDGSSTGSEPEDCAGTPGGIAEEDECGICEGDGTSCLDCAGVPNGDAQLDVCGVCNGLGAPCWGCTVPSASNYDPLATLNDGSCECDPSGTGIADQSNLASNAGAGSNDLWQSFTVGLSGGLTRLDLGVGSPIDGDSPGTLELYSGEGVTGLLLGSQSITLADVSNTIQQFELDEPVAMTAGEIYTYRLTVPDITVGFVDLHTSNPYDGGRASSNANNDYVFRTLVSQCIAD